MKKNLTILVRSILSIAICLLLMPNVKAQETAQDVLPKAKVEMKVLGDGYFYVGELNNFTISTIPEDANEAKKVNIYGTGNISDESGLDILEYQEGNVWKNLMGLPFGVKGVGFPLQNATSTFRAQFSKAGTYEVTYRILRASDDKVIAENKLTIEVRDTKEVSTEAELLSALANNQIKEIKLANDIEITKKVNITRNVVIDGQNHKVTFKNDAEGWKGNYVFQVYKATATIKNILFTGGDAALLVNGSDVTLEGTVNVSGNEFGGIELSQGVGVTTASKLTYNNASIVNTTEEYKKPTIWTVGTKNSLVGTVVFTATTEVVEGQTQYYLNVLNSVDTPSKQITEQLVDSSLDQIEVLASVNDNISKEVLNSLKGRDVEVVIEVENGVEISFNGKDIKDSFTKDLNLNVEITTEQPFESHILDHDPSKLLFIDLEYSGTLPTGTHITFDATDMYSAGDTVALYYYNSKTDKAELISKNVTIDKNGKATILIDHASTYFLSKTVVSEDNDTTETNGNQKEDQLDETPNTSVVNYMEIAGAMVLVSLAGITILEKRIK